MTNTTDMINSLIHGLQHDMDMLKKWLTTHYMYYVVVSKDRMYVVQRDEGIAKIAVYPQLPTMFYSGDAAYHATVDFKAYKGDGTLIELDAVVIKEFATAAIKDFEQRIADLRKFL